LTRAYRLSYLDDTGTNSHWSFLSEVQPIGSDGTNALPAITFDYRVSDPPDTISAANAMIGGINEPASVMDSESIDLIDINGDALPDLLRTYPYGGAHIAYLNQGETNTPGGAAIQWSGAEPLNSEDGLAWNIDLESSTQIAHLADMDGDGIADLVYKSVVNDLYYFRNKTDGSGWGSRQPMSIQDYAPPSPFGSDPNVKTADIDFDKRIDIIQSIDVGGGADYNIWFNRGEQTYSQRVTVPQTDGVLLSLQGVSIADFNGDRVPDMTRIRSTSIEVTAGLGHGNFANKITVPLPDWNFTGDQLEKAKLTDITGDGLVDLVIERAAPNTLWYWVNQGNYTLSTRKQITGMPSVYGINPTIRWADINGNGTIDLIYADSSATPRMQAVDMGRLIGNGFDQNMLIAIDNGIGLQTRIDYRPSTDFLLADRAQGRAWPDPLPFSVKMVSQVSFHVSPGLSYTNRYQYHEGYYDAEEKEFRGFAWVEQIQVGDESAPSLLTQSHMDTGRDDESMKAKLLSVNAGKGVEAFTYRGTTILEAENLFFTETNFWAVPKTLYTGFDGREVVFAYHTNTVKTLLEEGRGSPKTIEIATAYDNYGNATWVAHYGVVGTNRNRSYFDDERITTNEYAINTNQWILRAVARQEMQDEHGNVITRTENYYDDPTFSSGNFGVVTQGNLTLVRTWIDPTNAASYVDTMRNQYDSYGNLTHILDPLATAPGGVPDPNGGHYRQLLYDPDFLTYPEQEIIHVGNGNDPLTIRATYDPAFATVTSSTGPNGHTTTYGYDTFGRLIHIVKPSDTPEHPTAEYDYVLAHPYQPSTNPPPQQPSTNNDQLFLNWVETRQREQAGGGTIDARTYYDGMGRTLMTRSEGQTPGQIVVSATSQFNARGQTWKNYLPYFEESSSLDYVDPTYNTGFTEHFYDALGREIRINQPIDTNGVIAHSEIEYRPLERIVRDEEQTDPTSPHYGCGMKYVTDALFNDDGQARLREVTEIVKLSNVGEPLPNPVEWQTTYTYNLLDNLLGYTDSKGNQKINQYDALGRKITMNDVDRGEMFYTYDEVGNLTQSIDAKGQTNRYTYDGVNLLPSKLKRGSISKLFLYKSACFTVL